MVVIEHMREGQECKLSLYFMHTAIPKFTSSLRSRFHYLDFNGHPGSIKPTYLSSFSRGQSFLPVDMVMTGLLEPPAVCVVVQQKIICYLRCINVYIFC